MKQGREGERDMPVTESDVQGVVSVQEKNTCPNTIIPGSKVAENETKSSG